ncbi:MAG TPA: hypothetical protein VKE40_11010 [Gemmataceae bacterium]|nr:hypothetical protein [Gemmataceae bacterium]
MTRFETAVCLAIVAGLAALHAPAFGQVVVTDGVRVEAQAPPPPGVKVAKGKKAQPSAQPEKPEPPTFVVKGDFKQNKEKAFESAIQAAVEKFHEYLMEQDPPVTKVPTTEMIRKMLVKHPDLSQSDTDLGKVEEGDIEVGSVKEKQYRVEVAVKVKPQDIRVMRTRERSSEALWVLAGLGGLAGVLAVFFRIDSWTKGYLTSWLLLGTVGAASLLTGLWWWAK